MVTIQAMRGWRTRCLALESSLTAVRRELELVASARRVTVTAARPTGAPRRR
jgi:hypothetical protein